MNKATLLNFLSKVSVSGLGFITVIITSKLFGAEGRGEISLFLTNVALIQLFCDFGNSSANINLSYKYDNLNIWKTSAIWIIFVCLISIIPLYYLDVNMYVFVSLSAFLLSINNNNLLILMGNRQVNKRNLSLLAVAISLLISVSIMYNLKYTIDKYYIFYIFTILLGIGFSTSWVRQYLKNNEKFKFNKEVLKKGFLAQAGHFVQFLNYRLFFYFIVFYLGKFELGVFNNLIVLAESLWIIGHSIGQILHLKILNTENSQLKIKLTNQSIVYSFIGTSLLFILLNTIPMNWWLFIFNKDFSEISILLPYLGLGVILFSISNIINHYLHAMNEFKKIIWINLVGLLAGVVTCLLLIEEMKLVGVCISWSIAFACSFILSVFFYSKKIKQAEIQ